WHISLSTWLRDYLYISLGGNRIGPVRTYVNLMLTMLLGGLWHGAAWNFVAWGGYHGVLLAIHRFVSDRRPTPAAPSALRVALGRLGMFHLVVLGWVFFRAPSLGDGMFALFRLAAPGYVMVRAGSEALIIVAVAILLHLTPPAKTLRERFIRLPPVVQGLSYSFATIAAFFLAPASERFIYFQF